MINNNLHSILKAKKISQRDFAEMIGFSNPGFIKALQNESLKVKDIRKILEVLQLKFEDIFYEKHGNISYLSESLPKYENNNNHKFELIAQENEALKREIALKNEIIVLLKSK